MAGDQQAATIGQSCFASGDSKVTYGTGAFLMLNTGHEIIRSKHRLLTTILYRCNNKTNYALEGSIFSAGTIVKWLRDTIKIIESATETESLARSISTTNGIYFVPAFTGLAAPYWQADVRAAIFGLTSNSNRAEIVRAALESIAYQTFDLLNAILPEIKSPINKIRVDGGMAKNDWLMQFLADILQVSIERPKCIETTALGVAYLSGLNIGIFSSMESLSRQTKIIKTFTPQMTIEERNVLYKGWQKAVSTLIAGEMK
jgi:glycerol kinase